MCRHPGRNLSIYDVASCVGDAHLKAMTPNNITGAFKKTGIYPLDDNIFTETDFMSSSVTYKPSPDQSSTSSNCQNSASSNNPFVVSPEEVRAYPKATEDSQKKEEKR